MVRRCACILLLEQTNKQIGFSRDAKVESVLWLSGLLGCSNKAFKDVVNGMLDAGSRLKNMEKHLGPGREGITLVLGKTIPDSVYVFPSASRRVCMC